MTTKSLDSRFSFISLSDVHLNHPNTPTEDILDRLNTYVLDPKLLTSIHAIFIVGDFWDRLVDLENPNSCHIKTWINRFLRTCVKYDLMLFVVEGTFTHDRHQSRVFITENENSNIGANVHFIESVCIKYLPEFNLNLLFVPDDIKPNPDDVWKLVKLELDKHNLEMVDFAFTHGTYEHHLPPHVHVPRHINARYESITRYYILNGHIHIHSINGKIITHGSTDRISHGEEGPKGFIKIDLTKADNCNITFITNAKAKLYITIDCRGLSVEDSYAQIAKYAKDVVGTSYRLFIAKNDPIGYAMRTLREMYPQYEWVPPKVEKPKHVNVVELQNNIKLSTGVTTINVATIIDMASKRIDHKLSNKEKLIKVFPNFNPIFAEELRQKAMVLLTKVIENGNTK